MEGLNLISTFAEFKELKNIDRGQELGSSTLKAKEPLGALVFSSK